MPNDMQAVIVPKSDQLNADDLIAGPITITITGVTIRSGGEQPISVHFEGDGGKPYKPCKGMCRVMVNAWGADSKLYTGRSMTLFREPSVKWAGMEVGGIQISHMTDIKAPMTMALTVSKQSRKPFTVKPLDQPKDATPSQEPKIDEKQIGTLLDLLNEHGITESELCTFGGLETVADLPARLFEKAARWIKGGGKKAAT